MQSDFSRLDAELEQLAGGASVDALALAHAYVGSIGALPEVDRTLTELGEAAKPELLRDLAAASSLPTEAELPRRDQLRERIVLPEPDELNRPQIGASARDPQGGENAPHAFAQAEQVDMLAEGDDAFAALFADASPASELQQLGSEAHADEPLTSAQPAHFDSTLLPSAEAPANGNGDANIEELDSAEFEIDAEDEPEEPTTEARARSYPPARESERPSKRPSFIGRLFGRKDD